MIVKHNSFVVRFIDFWGDRPDAVLTSFVRFNTMKRKSPAFRRDFFCFIGGAYRSRTDGLYNAIVAL